MLRIFTLITLLTSSQLYATEVYRSVDENGRTVYSGEPPKDKGHETVDIEVKNKLGSRIQPSPDTQYYRSNPSKPEVIIRKVHTNPYVPPKPEKIDMRALQEKCERYRNIVHRNDKQRKKRDYWCSRLHRGK